MNRRTRPFRWPQRSVLRATLFVAIVCSSIVAIETWRIITARSEQITENESAAANLSLSLAEQAASTFGQADALLVGLVERVETDGTGPANLARIGRFLQGQRRSQMPIERLSVLDVDGRRLTSDLDGPDFAIEHASREYFRYHATHPDRTAHLGPPIRGRTTGAWIVTISRRIDDERGRFAGVVVAAIRLDFFGRYYEQFDIGKSGAIALVMRDGTIVERRPFKEDLIGSALTDSPLFRDHIAYDDRGVAWLRSPIDGVARLTAFQKLDVFPAYAIVALSRDEVLHGWAVDSLAHGAVAAALVVLLSVLGARLIRQIARRAADQELLVRSQAELVAANEQLECLARQDGLTRLANRREFDRVLHDEVGRVNRSGAVLAMLLVDIDHFKAYNDTLGHPAGDACLTQVAARIATVVARPGDFAARYGGEEFVALLPGADEAGALAVAERLRGALRAAALPHPRAPGGIVTASIGVAVIRGAESDADGPTLLARCDEALYDAKRGGRDAIRISGAPRRDARGPTDRPPSRERADAMRATESVV